MVAKVGHSTTGAAQTELADITPDGHAFVFDLDGTLLEICARPESVVVAQGLIDSLSALVAICAGAVAIITGRTLPDVDGLLAPLKLAGAGIHGLQMRDSASSAIISADVSLPAGLRRKVHRFASAYGSLAIEDKGQAIAIHFRACPEIAPTVSTFAEHLTAHYGARLAVQHGKMVTEFTPPGADKGAALHAVMRLPAFLNRRPLYFGDDLADEAAFRVARHLGGAGVLVGHHGHPTSASCVLATPQDLHRLIASVSMDVEGWRASANATRCR